jgi:putative SOS response-associated peptidase YedK
MARLFEAVADSDLAWSPSIWQRDPIPVIVADDEGRRRLRTMCWGLDAAAFETSVPPRQRGSLYPRDLSPSATRLRDLPGCDRCVLVVEAFAYPRGTKGRVKRVWVGLDDAPLLAWAGLRSGDGCAGLLLRAPEALQPLTATIPLLLTLEDCGRWLAGAPILSLDPCFREDKVYVEYLGERWASGRTREDPRLAFAA